MLGNNPVRFWPFATAEENAQVPYGVWQIAAGSPENYLTNTPDADGYSIQVDVYAASPSQARAVAVALRDAIEPHAHIVAWRGESRDTETRLYRLSFDTDWHVSR